MSYFHLKLIAPRPTFPVDATEAEMALMDEHFAYWRDKSEAGLAIAVGPVFDASGPYGMALVETETQEDAEALGRGDPVVEAGAGFHYSVSPVPSLILRA